jgi:hypothetical protein
LAAVVVHEDLVAILGAEAINYRSVTRRLRETKFAISNPEVIFSQPIREHDDCDSAILLALDEQPCASICQSARLTRLPRTTVHRRFTQSLGFQVRHFRWVPHRLSDAQKLDRVKLSRALLSVLAT